MAAGRLFALQWVSHSYVHMSSTKCSVGYKKEEEEEEEDRDKNDSEEHGSVREGWRGFDEVRVSLELIYCIHV